MKKFILIYSVKRVLTTGELFDFDPQIVINYVDCNMVYFVYNFLLYRIFFIKLFFKYVIFTMLFLTRVL